MYESALVAAAIVLVYKVYQLIKIPAELDGLPGISLWQTFKFLLRSESYNVIFERVKRPILLERGVARMWIQGKWGLLIGNPQVIKEILLQPDLFPKRCEGDPNLKHMLVRQTLGFHNILNSDGEDWRKHRRVANPAFKQSFSPQVFKKHCDMLSKVIREGIPLDIQGLFRRLTLDVLGMRLFSHDFKAIEQGNDSKDMRLYDQVMRDAFIPIYQLFPILEKWVPSRKVSLSRALKFRGMLHDIVQKRKAELLDKDDLLKDDLLTSFIKASLEEGDFSEEDVVNDLALFFLAGHDSTANTLVTSFYYMSKHQHIQDRARDEIHRVLKGEDRAPTHEESKDMPYIESIIKESMRIVTTGFQLQRYCPKSVVLSTGLVIPKDTFVSLNIWAAHHDPEVYPDPNSFLPDRFLNSSGDQDAQLMSFGYGSRMCIGKTFSLVEQRVILCSLLQKFSFKLEPGASNQEYPKLNSSGLIHPIGVKIIFKSIK